MAYYVTNNMVIRRNNSVSSNNEASCEDSREVRSRFTRWERILSKSYYTLTKSLVCLSEGQLARFPLCSPSPIFAFCHSTLAL